ncbi:SRPBCC family protein [Pseudovibrio ascidiaceicola]|uniref:SRPBCC family protein n=1 Tax=Pseudovibrio TaxID=258255 RepID=UPI0007AEB784|nr:SRPBCC family protein [Pseudovibrio sp. Ad26]KZK99074.1 Polyketide cyclase / dehydrase and lipid transport [Pseudovibrio sp. Ad26]
MVSIAVYQTVNAPISTVWNTWNDYGNIDKFHPGLRASYLLGKKQKTGVGAVRQCDFTDGKTFLKERISEYLENQRITIDIYDTNAPFKDGQAIFEFTPQGPSKTRVTMTMSFTPKMGILGKLLTPFMKFQFKKGLRGLLKSNADYVEKYSGLRVAA